MEEKREAEEKLEAEKKLEAKSEAEKKAYVIEQKKNDTGILCTPKKGQSLDFLFWVQTWVYHAKSTWESCHNHNRGNFSY